MIKTQIEQIGMYMNEINDEILLTLNIMQTYIDEGAHGELQNHLYCLLEIKRNELQKRLSDLSREESTAHGQALYKSEQIDVEDKPLTVEDLKAGGWWCADVSKDCANAFESKGLRVVNLHEWESGGALDSCGLGADGNVTRHLFKRRSLKQIHRAGNEFYWSEK